MRIDGWDTLPPIDGTIGRLPSSLVSFQGVNMLNFQVLVGFFNEILHET